MDARERVGLVGRLREVGVMMTQQGSSLTVLKCNLKLDLTNSRLPTNEYNHPNHIQHTDPQTTHTTRYQADTHLQTQTWVCAHSARVNRMLCTHSQLQVDVETAAAVAALAALAQAPAHAAAA